MKRKIVEIDREKCNGCELCVSACHEGAIQMVDGKAELVSDMYCDGLGDCLPACPTDAIKIIERDADEYSQEAVDERLKELKKEEPCGCPGSRAMAIEQKKSVNREVVLEETTENVPSKLTTWPVQINLVNPGAPYLKGADILIAADCTAFAYGNFHKDFIEGRVCLIGCPKLDNNAYYAQKLADIFANNEINSITVVRMEVPCCSGIVQSVKAAMLNAGTIVPYNEVIIGLDGEKR